MLSSFPKLTEQPQSDEPERSSSDSINPREIEPFSRQRDGELRAVAIDAAYDETHGRFHADFDEFFIEQTVGELIAIRDDCEEDVRQEGGL